MCLDFRPHPLNKNLWDGAWKLISLKCCPRDPDMKLWLRTTCLNRPYRHIPKMQCVLLEGLGHSFHPMPPLSHGNIHWTCLLLKKGRMNTLGRLLGHSLGSLVVIRCLTAGTEATCFLAVFFTSRRRERLDPAPPSQMLRVGIFMSHSLKMDNPPIPETVPIK